MTTPICGQAYVRPDTTVLRCTYLLDHPTSQHSWFAAEAQDQVDATTPDASPLSVQRFLDAMSSGQLDPYLEAILAVGHNRKRARHGVIGFGAKVEAKR